MSRSKDVAVVVVVALAIAIAAAFLRCSPAMPRPVAPDALCAARGWPHETVLPSGEVAVCATDPTADFGPVSNFARRGDAGVRR